VLVLESRRARPALLDQERRSATGRTFFDAARVNWEIPGPSPMPGHRRPDGPIGRAAGVVGGLELDSTPLRLLPRPAARFSNDLARPPAMSAGVGADRRAGIRPVRASAPFRGRKPRASLSIADVGPRRRIRSKRHFPRCGERARPAVDARFSTACRPRASASMRSHGAMVCVARPPTPSCARRSAARMSHSKVEALVGRILLAQGRGHRGSSTKGQGCLQNRPGAARRDRQRRRGSIRRNCCNCRASAPVGLLQQHSIEVQRELAGRRRPSAGPSGGDLSLPIAPGRTLNDDELHSSWGKNCAAGLRYVLTRGGPLSLSVKPMRWLRPRRGVEPGSRPAALFQPAHLYDGTAGQAPC